MGNPAQPNVNAEANWPAARQIVADWLACHHTRPAHLAEQTGLNRSVISRFLAGKPLDHASALRVYLVVQPSLDLDARLALLEAMGLLPLALSLRESLAGASSARSVMSSTEAGVRMIAIAALQEGHTVDALEAAIAGVCLNPWATHGPYQRLRDLATEINDDVVRESGRRRHAILLRRIADGYAERRGYFAYTDHIAANCDDVFARLMTDLGGVCAQG